MSSPPPPLRVLGAVPIKPFAAAKQRLATVVAESTRSALSRALASHTLAALSRAGAQPLVLAADAEVDAWGRSQGMLTVADDGSSLDQAAQAALAIAAASDAAWLICHADLPLLSPTSLRPAVQALGQGRPVIAPSYDGGTNLLGARLQLFDFSYGQGSFHRHLRALANHDPLILVTPALALDLDQPADLQTLMGKVAWMAELLDSLHRP